MKLAIILNTLGAKTETFVTRHLHELNYGQNLAVYQEDLCKNSFPKLPKYNLKTPWFRKLPSICKYPILLPRLFYYGSSTVPTKHEQKRLIDFLVSEKVDVVLSEFGTTAVTVFPVIKKLNIPFFTYFRGHDASKVLNSWHVRYAYRKLIPQMEGIISVSPHLLDNLRDVGVYWKEAHVIPSGTDTNEFKPGQKDKNLILSVGRFIPKKAPHITIHAFSNVKERHPDAKLVMIGDGPLLSKCKELARTLKIDTSVTFMGGQDHSVVQSLMANASLFVLHCITSGNGNTEGFPSVIQEAMASGAVIVSTRHGGIPHFIKHGETGLLVDELDTKKYSDEISRLLNNLKLRKSMSMNSREYAVENLDYKLLYMKVETILNNRVN